MPASRPMFPSFVLLVSLAASSAGCSLFGRGGDDEALEPSQDAAADASKSKPAATSEHELKLAKLWARVDELEEQQQRTREKIRVLEKGFQLGLIPEELKEPEAPRGGKAKAAPAASLPDPVIELTPIAAADDKAAPEKPLAVDDEFQKALASAHDQFRAGRYARAVVEFTELARRYGESVEDGMPRYWIAKSWASLKEYPRARQDYEEFLKEFPTSAWAPRAKVDLAKVLRQMEQHDAARRLFQEVIAKHPYEEAAEMASYELTRFDRL